MTILAPHRQKYCFTLPLARLLGDANAASILSKIHHWIEHDAGQVFDGVRWIHNSYKDFVSEFPWLTIEQVKKFIMQMKSGGILKVERFTHKTDGIHSYWYSIDYEVLDELLSQGYTPQPRKSRGKHSGKLTPTSGKLTPTSGKLTPTSGKLTTSSIYTYKSSDKTIKENNSRAAADFLNSGLDPEKESPTPLTSKSQDVSDDTVTKVDSPEDKSSAAPRDNKTVVNLETLKAYGFELTRQLEKLAAKYSEEEIQKSLKHLTNCKKSQCIKNEPGWLTTCLEDKWYLSDSSLAQTQSSEAVENREEAPKVTWRLMTPEEEEARRVAEQEKKRKAREAMEAHKAKNKDFLDGLRAQVKANAVPTRKPIIVPAKPPVIEETLEENMARIAKNKARMLEEFRKARIERGEEDDLEF